METIKLTREMKILFLECLKSGSIDRDELEKFRDWLVELNAILIVNIVDPKNDND